MNQNIIHSNKLIFYLIFLCLLYPLFHGLFVYIAVYGANIIFNFENPYFNLYLLAWKETALLLVFILLFIKRKSYFLILFILIASLVFGSMMFLKDILLPSLLVYFVFDNIDIINKQVIEKKILIKKLILFIIFISIIISVWDLIFRINNNINALGFLNTDYLVTFNKIKCSKIIVYKNTANLLFNDCIYMNVPNFYKIFIEDKFYIAKQVLFMPVGDSVLLSYIFLYLILMLIFIKNSKFFNNNYIDLFLLCVICAQIFTFNRVNTIFSLIIFFYYSYKNKNFLSAIPIVLLFFYNFDNIFLSIFDGLVPSNIGHGESFTKLISESQYDYVNRLTITNILTVIIAFFSIMFLLIKVKISKKSVFMFFFIFTLFIMLFLNIPFSIFGSNFPVPTESNYLKIAVKYGIIGVALYSFILANIIYNINHENFYLKILSLNILVYQFIAPYIISGYTVFMPAILLMALFKNQKN
jgi:hypothetical protein